MDCVFQFYKYFSDIACILRDRTNEEIVAFLKTMSIFY